MIAVPVAPPLAFRCSAEQGTGQLVQGDCVVTADPGVMLTTILGSCIAACLYEPVLRVGGMDHFLLPGDGSAEHESLRHGAHATELLINGLLRHGARRARLRARLFRGGHVARGLGDIGNRNADFAEGFLRDESIHVGACSLRGETARQVEFLPILVRARHFALTGDGPQPAVAPSRGFKARPVSCSVELF
jgi:chemotaxis protein CheD